MLKKPHTLTDRALIEMLCGLETDRQKALQHIYVEWGKEAVFTLQKQGTSMVDTKDAVQEALIILDRQVREGSFKQGQSLKNYFIGIAQKRVYVAQRSQKRVDYKGELPPLMQTETPETTYLDKEAKDIIRQLLNTMETKCRDILKLYMLSYSMKEIRAKLNIVSDEMTRKTAFDCRKKLGQMIDNQPFLQNFFNYFE
jgi:RNA polymerase sigma factor (sigma-70 family)